jgi:hypothetical protein
MLTSPPSEVSPLYLFVCAQASRACANQSFFKEHAGRNYCVFHYPAPDKIHAFNQALKEKLASGDSDFSAFWFPDDLDISETIFNSRADFTGAVFNGEVIFSYVNFNEPADFTYAVFHKDVYFSYAWFRKAAIFDNTSFRALAYFRHAVFDELAKFESATFSGETDFTVATFTGEVNLGYATFASYLKFSGDAATGFGERASLQFPDVKIERPERVSFNTLTLMPHWFVHVDPRQFEFTNVTWGGSIGHEVEKLKQQAVATPRRSLATTYRRLAANAKQNNRYEEANFFRYAAMDTERRRSWLGLNFWKLEWWYWAASGYGRKHVRALLVLLGVWIVFALLYTRVGFERVAPQSPPGGRAAAEKVDEIGQPLKLSRAFTYSLGVLTLQKPEPRPVTPAAQLLVLLETILGPLQVALFVLAIRRKFGADLSEE